MRHPLSVSSLLLRGPGAFAALLLLLAAPTAANAETECSTDADCAAGEFCAATPCAGAPCEDGDEDCESEFSCPSFCLASFEPEAECASDADCPDGHTCVIETQEACSADDCPPGADCDREPSCETYTYAYCQFTPDPCSSDADCDGDYVCLTIEDTSCSGGGSTPPCSPDGECGEPEPFDEECITETRQFCGPRWLGACETAADCGAGFSCEQAEICSCSSGGGGGHDGWDSDDAPDAGSSEPQDPRDGGRAPDEDDCSCEPAGDFYCRPEQITCDANADCPAGWTCYAWGDSTEPCYYDEETGESFCPEPSAPTSYCTPPGYEDFIGGGSDGPGIDRGESETDAPPATVDGDDNGLGGTGGLGQDGGGRPGKDEDGCSASAAPAAPAGFLALLALVGLRRRRN